MNKNLFSAVLVLASALGLRILNTELEWWHFTPFLAIGVFSGAHFTNKALSFIVPLASFLLSDLYLQIFTDIPGFYGLSQVFTYGAYLIAVLLGTQVNTGKWTSIVAYTFASTLAFWVISNAGTWLDTTYNLYTKDFNGLMNCYIAALPFYKSEMATSMFTNSVLANLSFAVVLFALVNFAGRIRSAKQFA